MIVRDENYEKLQGKLESLLDKDIYAKRTIESCPHCKGGKIIKHGRYKNGQRYLCKGCYKTFCIRTNTPLYRTKKPAVLWAKYVELLLSKVTLRECAKELNISLRTAFFWRHKLLHTLVKVKEPNNLIKSVNIMKLLIKENYKGDRNAPSEVRRKVWTIVATDVNKSILARPISLKGWNKRSFDKIIYWRINNESHIYAFLDRYLDNIAKSHNKEKDNKKVIFNKTLLGVYTNEVRRSLRKFYGVATKYLVHYLYFLTIFPIEKRYTAINLLYRISGMESYIKNREFFNLKVIDI